MSVGAFFCVANNLHAQGKYTDVRLKENSWIRIEKSVVEEISPEIFYKGDKQMIDIHKRQFRDGMVKRENFRKLHITIQFLKPCTANTLYDEVDKEFKREFDQTDWNHPERIRPMSPKSQLFFSLKTINLAKEQGKDIGRLLDVYDEKCKKYGIDGGEFINDLFLPQFRCDYRTKIFATFFSNRGVEIATESTIPWALLLDSSSDRRKTEMVPGETSFVTFSIPDNASNWHIWVPK